ncbi:MAG: gamma carbonic anhydrase family protein [Candidatus Heimdallarchaeota archaeon]|nr:MAG: gamma carbonic anhydrase family protein [Candidatus Heimdallarchaeota archaeon]
MALYEFEGKKPKIAKSTFVFPSAVICGDVRIGENCFIAPNAVLRGDWGYIEIGSGSNVQDTCVIHSVPDEGTILGENCHIGHGAVVHQAELGKHVLVGKNAVIMNWSKIGDDCIIGSGCVVPQNTVIEPNSLVIGVPGKVVGQISKKQKEYSLDATKLYQTLPERYHKSLKAL